MADLVRIPVGAGALHVERYGFGDRPLVLLHGFGTSAFLWRQVAPRLPLGRVTAYAVDLLGWGESEADADADYGVAAQAEYLDRALTVLRASRVDVVTVDVGAAVALALAARRPARVRSLALLNPGDPAHLRGADFAEFERGVARSFLDASVAILGAAIPLAPILERSVARPERMPRALVARYAAPFVGREGFRHLTDVQRAVNDRALHRVGWERVGMPVLVVRGDADAWVGPEVSAALASRFPRGELRQMHGAARLIPEDEPEWLASVLTEWTLGEPASGGSRAIGEPSTSR